MKGVDIQTYRGDGGDLAALVNRTWRTNFGGRMWFPLWDRAYFAWRLLDERAGGRDFLLAAYRENEIVGCLLAEPVELRIAGELIKATLSSFFSVDPTAQAPGIALRLLEALRRRHREHGISLSIGVTALDPNLPNRRFLDTVARRRPRDIRFLQPISFWVRVLDIEAVSAASLTTFERIGARISGLTSAWGRRSAGDGVRPFAPDDLGRCQRWLSEQAQLADVAMTWPLCRLELQLGGSEYAKTLVVDAEDGRGAFLNYYVIDWLGSTEIKVGFVDLFAGDAPMNRQIDLLKIAVERMVEEKVDAAMMMASAAAPARALFAAGFARVPTGSEVFSVFQERLVELHPPLRLHVPFT